MVALHSGNPWEARRFLLRSLARQKKLFGKGHLALATTWSALGVTLASQGLYPAAKRWQGLAHDAILRAFGKAHFAYGQSLQAAAFRARQQRAFKKAIPRQQQALSQLQKALGARHFYVAMARHNLGLLRARVGQHALARRLLREALASARKSLPSGHYVRGVMMYNLGRLGVLFGAKPDARARQYLQRASALLLNAMGMTRSFTRKAWTLLAARSAQRPGQMIKALKGAKDKLSPAARKRLASEVRPLWLHQPLLLR